MDRSPPPSQDVETRTHSGIPKRMFLLASCWSRYWWRSNRIINDNIFMAGPPYPPPPRNKALLGIINHWCPISEGCRVGVGGPATIFDSIQQNHKKQLMLCREQGYLVGGFNPSEKYQSNWIMTPKREENKKYLKPPSRYVFFVPRVDSEDAKAI